jgi:hypothetical protein
MNIGETKYMTVGTDTNHLEIDNGDMITGCIEFRYLETIFITDRRDSKNISHRVKKSTENNSCIKLVMGVKIYNK